MDKLVRAMPQHLESRVKIDMESNVRNLDISLDTEIWIEALCKQFD